MKQTIVLLILIALRAIPAISQTAAAIEAGQQVPDLKFENLLNYPEKTARLSDFRGKLIILDFWDTSCSPCIAAMPKLDSLQRVFPRQVQIITISPEKTARIADFIQRTQQIKKYSYRFAFETENSQLSRNFPHVYVPHTVWISAMGKVLAVTDGSDVTLNNVKAVLAGQLPAFVVKTDRKPIAFNRQDPLSLLKLSEPLYYQTSRPADSIRYTSLITSYHPDLQTACSYPAFHPGITCTGVGIISLYHFGYNLAHPEHPMEPNRIILENSKPEQLKPPKGEQQMFEKLFYNYASLLPDRVNGYDTLAKAEKMGIRKLLGFRMLDDLETYFGFRVAVRKREMPCYVFKLVGETNLTSVGGPANVTVGSGLLGITYTNTRLSEVLQSLGDNFLRSHPYVNETGVNLPVNISLQVKLTEWKEVARALEVYGIGLTIENRQIDALVFEDL